MKMERHQLSANFPDMSAEDFALLVVDIKTNGQQESGLTYQGKVLDGWHRYQACEQVGKAFRFNEYKGSDPVGLVLSKNLHRRHLTATQRAAVAVSCSEWRKPGQFKSAPGADLSLQSASDLAKSAGVSVRTIEQAKAGQTAGLGDAMREGKVSAKRAAEVAKMPEAKRAKAMAERPAPKETPAPREKLVTRIATLEKENASLREQNEELKDGFRAASDQSEAAAAVLAGEPAKLILQLKAQIRALTVTADDWQNQCGQMRKQITMYEKKLGIGKVTAKPANGAVKHA